jgi:hypothetical protein
MADVRPLLFGFAVAVFVGCTTSDEAAPVRTPPADDVDAEAGVDGDVDASASAGDAGDGGPPVRTKHTYRPFGLATCDDGADGTPATGPDALSDVVGPGVVYSSEQRLDGVGQSCKTSARAGHNFFGGTFRTPDMNVGDKGDLWFRHAVYFPTGFCFGYGTTSGDGWGSTKWIRVEFDDGGPNGRPGSRLTLELGNFAPQGCNAAGSLWGAAREYAGTVNALSPNEAPITTGAWHMVQWHTHFESSSAGFIRFWLDDTYLGQWDGVTLPTSKPKIAFIQYGDYWNGSPYQDVDWYLDDVIISSETPDTLDSGGHPYISAATRATDWKE